MTKTRSTRRDPVYFCFANPAGFSGQKAATELVLAGLTGRGWICRKLPLPVFNRAGGPLATAGYLMDLLGAWLRSLRLLGARGAWLCVNLGQTRAAFLRDSVPLLLGRAGLGRARVVISLHGSLFMHWPDESTEAWVFRRLLRQAGVITVLGEAQRARLIVLGVPAERLRIVVNSCDMEPMSCAGVVEKHRRPEELIRTVHCLHLGALIDTKGYPEYLEALRRLSLAPGPAIEAVLCGTIAVSEYSRRFGDQWTAEQWILRQIDEINSNGRVRVCWINGAVGAEKAALFRDCEVFVLPSRYAVEAQPLVLLEAMASGCAIITTRAGEIPTILDERSAVFLAAASTDELTAALEGLVADAPARLRLAQAAHARFTDRFLASHHLDAWEAILSAPGTADGLVGPGPNAAGKTAPVPR